MSAKFKPTLNKYSGVRPFRAWVQMVLPQVYDDALSYQELLYKVLAYMNSMLGDLNAMQENIDLLNDAYAKLEDYVNNYLDGIDIEGDVSNKLDEMAENGTLLEILTNITQTYVVNVTYAGVENDGTDVSDKLNELAILHPTSILYFPEGTYKMHNVNAQNCSLFFDPNTVIEHESSSDLARCFYWENAHHIEIKGGTWRIGDYGTEVLPTASVDGGLTTNQTCVFRFENCEGINIHDMNVEWCSLLYYCYFTGGCSKITVERCDFTHCLCDTLSFATATTFVHICNNTFTDQLICTNNDEADRCWNRPIFFAVSATSPTHNILIENNGFDNCPWECIDTHASGSCVIQNNRCHNSARFIQMYYTSGGSSELGASNNMVIKNNFCYNDDGYTGMDKSWIATNYPSYLNSFGINVTSYSTVENRFCVEVSGNTIINPLLNEEDDGAIRFARCDLAIISNNEIKYTSLPSSHPYLFYVEYSDFIFENNRVVNANVTDSFFYIVTCRARINNNLIFSGEGVDTPYFITERAYCRAIWSGNEHNAVNERNTSYMHYYENELVLRDDGKPLQVRNGYSTQTPVTFSISEAEAEAGTNNKTNLVACNVPAGSHLTITDTNDSSNVYDCYAVERKNKGVYLDVYLPAGDYSAALDYGKSTSDFVKAYPSSDLTLTGDDLCDIYTTLPSFSFGVATIGSTTYQIMKCVSGAIAYNTSELRVFNAGTNRVIWSNS